METYTIQQLIYTKLNPEDSPFEKKDFHTAFYPVDLLTSTDVLIIENNIYIPTTGEFDSKQAVYFQTIKDENYMLVFDIKMLPGEVDTMGRAGIFIAHLFMFPEALWQQVPSPNQLMKLVKEYTYSSRADLLKSPYIDKSTGNIKPIELSHQKVEAADIKLPALEGLFERQLLLNLIDGFKPENKEHKFIVNGTEPELRELFNTLICYLPNIHKPNVGWDTQYDGGRMMDYNKIFVGYQQRAPRGGGGSSEVNIEKGKIELSKDFKTSSQQHPFANWLGGCASSTESQLSVEKAHRLSEALLAKEIYELPDDWNVECFANVNKELIEKLFLPKCKKEFKRKLSKELNKIMSTKDKLFFYFDKLETSLLTDYLLIILDQSKISAGKLESGMPQKYIKHSTVLMLIEELWNTEKFDTNTFSQLSDNQKLQVNKYVMKTSLMKSKWYLELIKNDDALLWYYRGQYPKPKKIISLFRKVLKMNEEEIRQVGFKLSAIRKVFYFRMAHTFGKIRRIFKRKKRN